MTTPSRDRRSHAAGPSGRSHLGRVLLDRGAATSLALAWALVLAPMPALAGAPAEPPPTDGGAAPGASEPDDQVARAMAAYERGTQNYNLAQYEAALADFTEAASLYASPDFQYNIGLCYEKLGKYEDAIRAFATYLRAKPDAEDRPNVEHRIHELEQALEQRKREAEEREARLAEADREPQPQPQPEPRQVDEPPPSTAGRPLIIAGSALAGFGAAVALGGGIAFGVLASKRSAAVDEVLTGGNPEDLSFGETQDLEAAGKRFEGVQIGLAAGGAVVAVTGAVLLALGLRKRQAGRSQAALGGSRAAGRWRPSPPAPFVGPTAAGLVLTSRF